MKKMFFAAILIFACILALPVFCGCEPENENSAISTISEESVSPEKHEVIRWLSFSEYTDRKEYTETPLEYTLPEYPDVTFVFDGKLKAAYKGGSSEELPLGSPRNIIFADLTGDGIRDICVTVFENLPQPPEISSIWMGYKIRVYDPVTKTSGTLENTEIARGKIIFRVENGELFAVSYGNAHDLAKYYTDLRFETETGKIDIDAADPEHRTKEKLACSPVVTSLCIYTYGEDHTSIKTYRLLTDELIERMEAISTDVVWKKINPDIWAWTDRVLINPLYVIYFEDCVLNVYPSGNVTVLFSDIEYHSAEGGETLADYITSLNEKALPYK